MPRETAEGERRVALVPQVVERLRARGRRRWWWSPGPGLGALIPDERFTTAGAVLGDPWTADVVVTVAPPTGEQVRRLRRGAVLIGFLAPLTAPETVAALRAAGVHGVRDGGRAADLPGPGMDALSSQANVTGYSSVLVAAEHLTRYFPMLTTAAGTVKPATVLVLGVGVAGLQALATAKRLGARTTGYDVRPEVAEQVRSLGAQWLDLGIEAVGEGGYARELTEDERTEQQKRLEEAITGFDVVITTANVPGRRAPTLVTAAAVAGMRPGSVVVDLAGESGGNCALTTPGGHGGAPRRDGDRTAEPAGVHARARLGAVRAQRRRPAGTDARRHGRARAGPGCRSGRRGAGGVVRDPGGADLMTSGLMTGGTSGDLLADLAILVLAGFVGFAVISKVPNTLHTPLMSGTNAIHGIVLLGGIVVLGRLENPSLLDAVVLVVAIVFGMINVVGGFLVTDRMLGMFKPKKSRSTTARAPRTAT